MGNKSRNKQIRLELVKSALRAWDPIGVVSVSPDEYDSYASGLLKAIVKSNSANSISAYFAKNRFTSMGFGLPEATEQELLLGQKIFDWKKDGYDIFIKFE